MFLSTIAVVLFCIAGVMYAMSKAYPNSMVSFGLAALTWVLLF